MTITPILALPSVASLDSPALSPVAQSNAAAGGDAFGDTLAALAKGVGETLRSAENTAISGLSGQASTQQVVEAVTQAERSLQTAIAIRDKAVSAYLELTRMPI